MKIEVFPTIGAVSIEIDDAQLDITQESLDGDINHSVYIPRRLVVGFLDAVISQLNWDDLCAINQLCEEQAKLRPGK